LQQFEEVPSRTQNPATFNGHEGSTPSFGTIRINDLQESNLLHTPQKGMTLPVTLPIAPWFSTQAASKKYEGMGRYRTVFLLQGGAGFAGKE